MGISGQMTRDQSIWGDLEVTSARSKEHPREDGFRFTAIGICLLDFKKV